MKAVLDVGVLGVTLLLMVTAGVELAPEDFRAVLRRKSRLVGALLLPTLLLPLLGFGVTRWLDLPPPLAAGLLLIAACPVGDFVNVCTLLARGNLALAISVNALSCLLSLFTMAAVFAGYAWLLGHDLGLAPPAAALVLRLFLLVVLPVLAGMTLRRWWPDWAVARRSLLHQLCVAGIVFILGYVLVVRWEEVVAGWRQIALASLVLLVLAMSAALLLTRLLRLEAADRITFCLLCGARNVALATAIAVTILDRIEFAEVAAVYFIVEVPVLLAVVAAHRRGWLAGKAAS